MRNRNSRRGGFTFWEAVIVLATLLLLAAILFPIFGRSRGGDGRPSCRTNLKQIGLCFKEYIQDYDEKYPPIASSPNAPGWGVTLQPYLKSTPILQCNKQPNAPNADPTQPGYTDYWFNGRMAGVRESQIEHQELTLSIGDGESSDANYHLDSLPKGWRSDTSSPLYRHVYGDEKGVPLGGANFAFADGSVNWFRANLWRNDEDLGQRGFTFRIDSK